MDRFPNAGAYQSVHYTYVWQCAVCEHGQAFLKMAGRPGDPVFIPDLPKGWTLIGDMTICPRHEVTTLVDGKELLKSEPAGG